MIWDDDRIEKLKKLWAEGISASQIAGRLGSVTRNAVISKVHRLGLAGRATTSRISHRQSKVLVDKAKKKAASKKAPDGWFATQPPKAEPVAYVEPKARIHDPAKLVTFDQLEPHHCRWPVGDPRDDAFRFCGETKVLGQVYCKACCEVAFRPRGVDGKPLKLRSPVVAGGQIKVVPHVETPEPVPAAGEALVDEMEDA